MFERPHHQRIAHVLHALDGAALRQYGCLFGGGTCIALCHGEYRESIDIDFLVSNPAGYRELRQRLTGPHGLAAITHAHAQGAVVAKAARAEAHRPQSVKPMPRRPHHHVYVVELSKAVLDEPRFRKNNPGYVDGKPCVYVGMTGLNPDLRFDKHKAGIQANRFVQQYGLRLLPDLYEGFNPMPYQDAVDREIEIGIDLRSAGFGVWQA